jgi:hypothetical protein
MRRLVLCVVVVACQREPAADVEAPRGRINTVPRARVASDLARMTGGPVGLPARGVFWVRGGLGAHGPVVSQVSLDADAHRADAILPEAELGAHPIAHPLDDARARALWLEADAVWAAPKPATDDVTDYAEYLVVVDGDAAWELSASGPIHASPAATLIADLQKL